MIIPTETVFPFFQPLRFQNLLRAGAAKNGGLWLHVDFDGAQE